MELGIQKGYNGEFIHVRVKRRSADMDGKTFGVTNENRFKDYQRYEVQYVDGMTEKMYTKIIDENVLLKVYKEGKMKIILFSNLKLLAKSQFEKCLEIMLKLPLSHS